MEVWGALVSRLLSKDAHNALFYKTTVANLLKFIVASRKYRERCTLGQSKGYRPKISLSHCTPPPISFTMATSLLDCIPCAVLAYLKTVKAGCEEYELQNLVCLKGYL